MLISAGMGRPQAPPYSVATNFFDILYGVTDITYSESNMRAAMSGSTHVTAKLILPKGLARSGRFALEFEVVTVASMTIGILDLAAVPAPTAQPDNTLATAWAYVSSGTKRSNGSAEAYGASYTSGDKVTILLDASGATCSLSFAKNGADQGVAYSGISGTMIPYFAQAGGSGHDVRVSSALTYTFSGYTQWR